MNLEFLTLAKQYGITLAVFLSIDMVWLLFIAKDLYAKQLGYLMAKSVNFGAAFLFYLLFVAGLLNFVIRPALAQGDLKHVIFMGLFFGLVTYATYDLTNQATVRDWPVLITVIDLIWGSTVSALTASLSFWLIQKFL